MKELKDLKLKDQKKIQELTLADLKKEIKESEIKFFTLKMRLATDGLKQTHLVKFLRKYIASLRTVLASKWV